MAVREQEHRPVTPLAGGDAARAVAAYGTVAVIGVVLAFALAVLFFGGPEIVLGAVAVIAALGLLTRQTGVTSRASGNEPGDREALQEMVRTFVFR